MTASRAAGPPTILSQFRDPANICSLLGLVSAIWGLSGAFEGRMSQVGVAIMAATLFDILDGTLARATPNRSPVTGRVGVVLDSLIDLVAGGVLAAAAIISIGQASLFAVAIGTLSTVALACRLAYFSVVGMDGGSFVGAPVIVNQLVVAALLLLPVVTQHPSGHYLLGAAMVGVAIANVSGLRVPKPGGRGMLVLAAVSAAVLAAHLAQWGSG